MKFLVSFVTLLLSQQKAIEAFTAPVSLISKPTTTCIFAEGGDQQTRINFKHDLDSPKVATQDKLSRGDKKVYCRCWQSGTFPLCDGQHMKHNEATGDNVGPLIVSIPKAKPEEVVEESKVSAEDDKKIEGRKKRLVMGYKATTFAYFLSIIQVASKTGLTKFAAYFLSSRLLTAGVAYIMSSAAENDRLSSDTYKRLNLAMIGFGVIGLIVQALLPNTRTAIACIAAFLTMVNAVKGYGYGVLGWDKKKEDASIVKDLANYPVSVLKGVFSIPKNMKSFGYLGLTGMVGTMKVIKLVELVQVLKEGTDKVMIATRLSRFASLSFLAMVAYTLKDAADRDRLEGSTFIELNFLAALSLATMSAYVGFNSRLGGFAAFFSGFSAFNGLASIQKKQSKA
mmetsp:Transcript_82/g.103  ORF Transcript_82/g.103 Transcript_82/m.103 type:complete len:397 (-) Transcript_82:1066-2256(-)